MGDGLLWTTGMALYAGCILSAFGDVTLVTAAGRVAKFALRLMAIAAGAFCFYSFILAVTPGTDSVNFLQWRSMSFNTVLFVPSVCVIFLIKN